MSSTKAVEALYNILKRSPGRHTNFAAYQLAKMYEDGQAGVPAADKKKAVRMLRVAAEGGFAMAQYDLGVYHELGMGGVKEDLVEATRLWRLAAAQGHVEAAHNLGVIHLNGGVGITQDREAAVKWFHLAAKDGHASSEFNLGVCFIQGMGVAYNAKEAVKFFRRAADKGHAKAQFMVAECLRTGTGFPTSDLRASIPWYRKSADQSNPDAKKVLPEIVQTVAESDRQAEKIRAVAPPGMKFERRGNVFSLSQEGHDSSADAEQFERLLYGKKP